MLKGIRDGILKKVQPVSIHGQVSWDVFFTDVEDPDGQITVARIGPEAVIGNNLDVEYGRRIARRGVQLIVLGTDGDLFVDAIRRMAGVKQQ